MTTAGEGPAVLIPSVMSSTCLRDKGDLRTAWAAVFTALPSGDTPLGNAVNTAAQAVLKSPLSRKHVLDITDGINTAGPSPAVVIHKVKQQAEQNHTSQPKSVVSG